MLDVKLKLRSGHVSERVWMESPGLRQLFWNVTYACNFRCGICFTDAGLRHDGELTTSEASRMVNRAAEIGVKDIIISGGEPFLRPDLPDMLALIAERGMSARIASNGSLITREPLEFLRSRTSVKSFQISLDTLDPALYARIHGSSPDMLPKVVENLRLIEAYGFHTTVSVRLTPETIAGIPALLERASSEGWSTVTIHCPVHIRRTQQAFPRSEDVLALLEPVLTSFAAMSEAWLVETYIPWAPYHPVMKRLANRIRVVHRGCRAGRDRLSIHPSGAVSPCVCMDVPEAYIGNVRYDEMAQLFESAPLCRLMRAPWDHGICTDCPQVRTCGGGCRAAALTLTQSVGGRDTSCPLARAPLWFAEN